MRVGIDLDGVCYDFAGGLRHYLVYVAQTHEPEDCPPATRWEFYEDWGLSLDMFLDVFHDGVNAGVIFTHGDPFPNVAEAFAVIRSAGHTIHIVTDRRMGAPGASERATSDWLHQNGLDFNSLTFSPDKTIAAVDVMIDDKIENYDALDAANVKTFLLDRPWNQRFDRPRRRVKSLLDFAELIA